MKADGTSPPKLVYLAGPIDLVDQNTAQGWRSEAAELLREHGYGVFSPAHAFELPPDRIDANIAMSVLNINNAAMQICDAILANLAGPGYGTPIEFDSMLRAGKSGACFNGNLASLYVKTWPHYTSMGKAIAALTYED